ncbi:HPP family protein, partial [Elsinoe ampelina]
SILPRLPILLSYPLGFRKTPPPSLPTTVHTLISVITTFLGLLTVTAIVNFAPQLQHISTPVLIPSLGAGAVLNYVTPNLPAAQPRPTILGQTISATVGVAIAKGFERLSEPLDDLAWLAVPTAVAVAVLAMRLTNTVHPPGGATAALTVATSSTRNLSWWIVALVALSTSTMVGVGLVVNNIGRKWPEFWWSSEEM